MQDPPTIDELLAATSAFLREVAVPQLAGHSAFHARVAANALDLVRRELELRPAAEHAEQQRLATLLQAPGSLYELNELLSARLTAGEMDLGTPGLTEHLWATALAKLAIDQPTYAPYRREAAQ
jgi:DNA-binding response OmpR family regulator